MSVRRLLATLVASWLIITPAAANQSSRLLSRQYWPDRFGEFMSGSWGGVRDQLHDMGISISGGYAASAMGNPVGGMSRGIAYAGLLNLGVGFDLDKIIGLDDGRLFIAGSWASAAGNTIATGSIASCTSSSSKSPKE